MKKSALILCIILGTLGGLLITLIGTVVFGLMGGGLSRSDKPEWALLLSFEATVMIGLCIPIQFLREKLHSRFGIPAPLFIASVSALPLAWSIYERARHLYLVAHDGYDYFMGGLGFSLTELFSLTWLVSSIAFFAGQIIFAVVFALRRKRAG